MLLFAFATTSRFALLVLLTTSLAFATTACVSSTTLSHNTTLQRSEGSTSSLRVASLSCQFNWSDQTAPMPGS